MSPEFLRQGNAVYDTRNPDSVVIGELDRKSGDFLEAFSSDLYVGQDVPILRMNLESAELVKYGRNMFLAMNISYVNEMARICEMIPGIDIKEVVKGIGADWRINPTFLNAGAGYGGSCLPKDMKALIAYARSLGYEPQLLQSVEDVNYRQARHMVAIAEEELGELKGKRVALLGLSFKPNTDDMREAPSIKIARLLEERGANIIAYDPKAIRNAREKFICDTIRISYAGNVEECLRDADCCMLVTEWDEFEKLGPEVFNNLMKTSFVIDGRRIYDKEFQEKIQKYRGIGLGK